MRRSLFKELKEYAAQDYYPFHMPGHKRNPESGPLAEVYRFDITEIDGFDNLYQAEGILKSAQEYAAQIYHSQKTYFLVNGSTAGILSSVSALSGRGRKLLIARNCHKAVYHAAFLNHFEVDYLYPEENELFGISCGITLKQVQEKLEQVKREENISDGGISLVIAGIVLTSPTYEGILSDVRGIVEKAHQLGIPVIVDQAHGAHFGFHPGFPASAVEEGADLVVHSVHKTLPAPTQTALLHHNGTLVKRENLERYLRIYQSSSPSYLLMAGIDCCMELLEREGRGRLETLLRYRRNLEEDLTGLRHIRIYPSIAGKRENTEEIRRFAADVQEAGKILISVRGTGFSGHELYEILRNDYRLQMEMCGADYVLGILTMMDQEEGFIRLRKALIETDEIFCVKGDKDKKVFFPSCLEGQPERVLQIGEAFMAQSEYIALDAAQGRIAADFVNFYPPGIPILVPGERMENSILQMIGEYVRCGYTVQGICREKTGQGYFVKVIRDSMEIRQAGKNRKSAECAETR